MDEGSKASWRKSLKVSWKWKKKNKLELEVEPEVLTELLQFHGKTLTFEHLLLMDEHRK